MRDIFRRRNFKSTHFLVQNLSNITKVNLIGCTVEALCAFLLWLNFSIAYFANIPEFMDDFSSDAIKSNKNLESTSFYVPNLQFKSFKLWLIKHWNFLIAYFLFESNKNCCKSKLIEKALLDHSKKKVVIVPCLFFCTRQNNVTIPIRLLWINQTKISIFINLPQIQLTYGMPMHVPFPYFYPNGSKAPSHYHQSPLQPNVGSHDVSKSHTRRSTTSPENSSSPINFSARLASTFSNNSLSKSMDDFTAVDNLRCRRSMSSDEVKNHDQPLQQQQHDDENVEVDWKHKNQKNTLTYTKWKIFSSLEI